VFVIITLGIYQCAMEEWVYLTLSFFLGFRVFGPQSLIGVAAVGFVSKKAISAADDIKETFVYLVSDSFAKLGLGMMAVATRFLV